jgi:hypothetical protein
VAHLGADLLKLLARHDVIHLQQLLQRNILPTVGQLLLLAP